MKLSPIFGLPIAEPDDARRDFPTMVDDPRTTKLEQQLLKGGPIFASAAARDTAIPAPAEGQTCWLTDLHQMQSYRGGWKPVGGVLPRYENSFSWGGAAAPIGYTRLGHASSITSVQGGGLTHDGAGTVTITTPGIYQVRVWVEAVLTGGSLGASWGTKAGAASKQTTTWGGGNGGPSVAHVDSLYLAAGQVVAPWMYAYSAATVYAHNFSVEWRGMV